MSDLPDTPRPEWVERAAAYMYEHDHNPNAWKDAVVAAETSPRHRDLISAYRVGVKIHYHALRQAMKETPHE